MSVFRVVMVRFIDGVSEEEVAGFRDWLETLAARTPGLLRMVCGANLPLGDEAVLASKAPAATYGDFASIWEFDSTASLSAFVDDPDHHAMAGSQFKRVVAHRYVFNIGSRE